MSQGVNNAEEEWNSSVGARTLEERWVYFLLSYVLVLFIHLISLFAFYFVQSRK
jgi:hypothetical protein